MFISHLKSITGLSFEKNNICRNTTNMLVYMYICSILGCIYTIVFPPHSKQQWPEQHLELGNIAFGNSTACIKCMFPQPAHSPTLSHKHHILQPVHSGASFSPSISLMPTFNLVENYSTKTFSEVLRGTSPMPSPTSNTITPTATNTLCKIESLLHF